MTVVLAGPSTSVDGPTPSPPDFRLLDSVTVVDSNRVLNGADLWSYPTDLAKLYAPCTSGTFSNKDLENEMLTPEFGPFGVYLPVTCSLMGLDQDELRTRAIAAFNAVESEAVEREFRNGLAQPDNPFLNDANVYLINSGSSLGPVQAMGALERVIGYTGKKGVIHTDPSIASAWFANNLLVIRGERVYTNLGTFVVVGHGYYTDDRAQSDTYFPVGGSTGVEEAEGWAYATGPVIVYRGRQDVLVGIDQTINDYAAIVERSYLVAWDTKLQAAVYVDPSTTP